MEGQLQIAGRSKHTVVYSRWYTVLVEDEPTTNPQVLPSTQLPTTRVTEFTQLSWRQNRERCRRERLSGSSGGSGGSGGGGHRLVRSVSCEDMAALVADCSAAAAKAAEACFKRARKRAASNSPQARWRSLESARKFPTAVLPISTEEIGKTYWRSSFPLPIYSLLLDY